MLPELGYFFFLFFFAAYLVWIVEVCPRVTCKGTIPSMFFHSKEYNLLI